MAKYIPLDAVLAAIEKMKDSVPHYITMAEKGAYIDCVNDAVDKIHSLEAKEVDLDALGVLAEHLIACDAHLVTPKYTDKELGLLEEWSKNNKAQKGE